VGGAGEGGQEAFAKESVRLGEVEARLVLGGAGTWEVVSFVFVGIEGGRELTLEMLDQPVDDQQPAKCTLAFFFQQQFSQILQLLSFISTANHSVNIPQERKLPECRTG